MTQNSILNKLTFEDFSVVSPQGTLVPNIPIVEFDYDLFDPTGAASGQVADVTALGDGHYRASFTPDSIGMWYLVVYHPVYFPAGKAASVMVYSNDFDSLADLAQAILNIEAGNWELVGSEMIFRKPDNTEIMRFTITTDGSGNPIKRERV